MILGSALQAQTVNWAKAESPAFQRPESELVFNVSFVDRLNGWALAHGTDGPDTSTQRMTRILHTADGGKSWSLRYQDSETYYTNVHFVDEMHGWMSGNGRVRRTVDGGLSWKLFYFDSTYQSDGFDMCFTDTLNGWVGCIQGRIFHTSDGGKSWQEQQSGTEIWLMDIEMLNENTGWIAGGLIGRGGVILNTINGGKTWVLQWSDPWSELRDLQIIDSLEVWAVGINNTLMHTVDGGLTWQKRRVYGPGAMLMGMSFLNPQYGWVVGEAGFIAYTFDGGTTWIPDSSGTNVWLTDVAFTDSETVCIVGVQSTFLYFKGSVGPKITSSPDTLAFTNEGYYYSIEAHASPPPRYSLIEGPQKARLYPITGFFSWVPTRNDTGRHQISVRVENPAGMVEQNYSLRVIHRNHPPIFSYLSPLQDSIQIIQGDKIRFLADAYDSDSDSLTFRWEINGIAVQDSIIYFGEFWDRFHTIEFVADSIGSHRVILSVWDFSDTTRHVWQIDVDRSTTINDASSGILPQSIRLHQNYPNPFNPLTTIRYDLPASDFVTLEIYNLLGQKIKTLIAGLKPAGRHHAEWDGKDGAGLMMPSGVYLCRINVGNFNEVRKVVLMR
jgi:photosystem II stability/assembly factor-like uncharacterized protein